MALSAGIEPATQTPEVHVISTSPREQALTGEDSIKKPTTLLAAIAIYST